MRISDWSSDVCSSDLSVSRRCGDIGIDRIYRRCRAYPPIARSATRTARADWSLLRRPFFKPSDQNYECSARLNISPFAARLFDLHFGHSVERSEEHTSELQSLMRTSYAVFCLKKK